MPRISFGLWIDAGLPSQTLAERLDEVAPVLEAAEESGFSSVFVGEAWPSAPRSWHEQTSSLLFLAALSRLTGLRLGTGVLLLPAWDPLRLAYDTAVLDQLSGGRLTVGVGSGPPSLATRFGTPRDAVLADRLDETLEALRALWSGSAGYSGRFVSVSGSIAPLPVQAGGPPLWVGGKVERALRRAARLGDGWYAATTYPLSLIERLVGRYRSLCSEVGRAAGPVAANRFVFVAGSAAEARREAAPYLAALDEHYAGRAEYGGDCYLVGDPASVNTELGRYAAVGVSVVAVRIAPAGLPVGQALRTVRLMGSEVIPAWR